MTMPTNEPGEFPANLGAFCRLAVGRLGYQDTDHVLDVLDENFALIRDREFNCCFDQRLAWAILRGEMG